jgi:DNA gyrase subunit B
MTNNKSGLAESEFLNGSAAVAQAAANGTVNSQGLGDYTSDSVKVLRDAAHIRLRPGMYIGDTGPHGLHHLVYELVHNSVDEALAGFCSAIHVQVGVDGSITVGDDGRGIPIEEHPDEKKPILEVVMTVVGAGAKFDKGTYKVSAGLHGMGAKAVTALSEWVQAEVRRNGHTYTQEYERGRATTGVRTVGAADRTGTRITFRPDPEIFKDLTFDYDTLENRLRELAFLNRGLMIKLNDERNGREELFKYDGGIAEFVEYLNRNAIKDEDEVLHKPLYMEKTQDGVRVEISFQYRARSEEERVRCYTNNAYNSIGGTHLSGFRSALTRTCNAYGNKESIFKNDLVPTGDDYREGLTAIISVQVADPQFDSQEKKRLNNLEVEGIVSAVVAEQLSRFLEENPQVAQKIVKKGILAAEAREAASKARKALKARKDILNSGGLPGKLYDCSSRDRDSSELFLVEGQSAGGSAEQGRAREFQAVLPLRGKVLNVEKARAERVIANEEIANLISVVGIDIGNIEDLSRLRYGKIIIMTDADDDGLHIRTLLLTFFYRQMRRLVEEGHVYVAKPPLYLVANKDKKRYIQEAAEVNRELMSRGLDTTELKIAVPGKPDLILSGERLTKLFQTLEDLERHVLILERRGYNLKSFLEKLGPTGLPIFRVLLNGAEHWFATAAEQDDFRRAEEQKLGRELVAGDTLSTGQPETNGSAPIFFLLELHEVRGINRGLDRLRELGVAPTDLAPQPRIAGREPPPRFFLEHKGQKKILGTLRELVGEVRKFGEKGLHVTRFKGLGEMNPDQLWETTLDPAKRTLQRIRQVDAQKADDMFRDLMGEKVEPRRVFIHNHAEEVRKDIDMHGS